MRALHSSGGSEAFGTSRFYELGGAREGEKLQMFGAASGAYIGYHRQLQGGAERAASPGSKRLVKPSRHPRL